MADHSGKIFPTPTPETNFYWESCRKHELCVQHCDACGHHQFYPRIVCSACMSDKLSPITCDGNGEITSFTVVRRAISEAYKPETPYVVALIRLSEGPTMMSNIVQCEPEDVAVGMSVAVVFEDWNEEISMPKFRPLQLEASS